MKLAIAVLVLASAGAARADSPFDVLIKPKATWTYDVVKGKKKTGEQVTLTATAVRTAGAYTVVEIDATGQSDDARAAVPFGAYVVGPDGVRALLSLEDVQDGQTLEASLAGQYANEYMLTPYVPATPKKKTWRAHLDRFGQDDVDYKVRGTVSKHGDEWRVTWTGHGTIPENGEDVRVDAETDFDPAVGFTRICAQKPVCLQLAR